MTILSKLRQLNFTQYILSCVKMEPHSPPRSCPSSIEARRQEMEEYSASKRLELKSPMRRHPVGDYSETQTRFLAALNAAQT